MWGRWWWCAGGGFLRQRVSSIGSVTSIGSFSHGYGEKLHPLDPPLLGLRGVVEVMCGGRRTPLSVVLNQIKRGVSTSTGNGGVSNGNNGTTEDSISFSEAKKLMRLVNVESLKMKLGMEGKEVICYSELLEACESMGIARSPEEAAAFARVLDEAGVVLLFRDKVYLHPDKVMFLYLNCLCLCWHKNIACACGAHEKRDRI